MKQHIKNLDTFRAIAAIVVMIGHIELFRQNHFGGSWFDVVPSGHTAVMMFFVISGFLITFLLTKEKEKYGTISLKDFYLRRVLRIYPLYYLILLVSSLFFLAPPSCKTIVYAVTILPNVSHAIGCGWSASPQIWSIGVENLFYIFFPLIMLFIPNKRMLLLLLIMTIGLAILPHAIDFVNVRTIQNESLAHFNQKFFFCNKFDSLLIGCLAGFAFADNHKLLKIIYNKWLFGICAFFAIVMWGGNIETKHFNDELMSVLFAVVILNVCTNTQLNITFENRVTKFLGRISYGIYMYHWIILLLAFKFLPIDGTAVSVVVLYAVVITATIIVAWLSYETYEKFFLNLKQRFER
ncbi:MAG: acyltransferase [Bacteroidales bacterium]|nr:acyltransferase [Bacteroidales bacterium]